MIPFATKVPPRRRGWLDRLANDTLLGLLEVAVGVGLFLAGIIAALLWMV